MGLAQGINRSILFMLCMVAVVPTVFGLAVWNAYRQARKREADGAADE